MDKTHPNWRAECGLVSEINPETGLAEWAPPGMHSPGMAGTPATRGSTPSSSATAPSQPVPVVVQGAVAVPSSNAEPPEGLHLDPAPYPSYGQPAYAGTVQRSYTQPVVAPAPQPMAAPAPLQAKPEPNPKSSPNPNPSPGPHDPSPSTTPHPRPN